MSRLEQISNVRALQITNVFSLKFVHINNTKKFVNLKLKNQQAHLGLY